MQSFSSPFVVCRRRHHHSVFVLETRQAHFHRSSRCRLAITSPSSKIDQRKSGQIRTPLTPRTTSNPITVVTPPVTMQCHFPPFYRMSKPRTAQYSFSASRLQAPKPLRGFQLLASKLTQFFNRHHKVIQLPVRSPSLASSISVSPSNLSFFRRLRTLLISSSVILEMVQIRRRYSTLPPVCLHAS